MTTQPFNPATMNPASIILPITEHFSTDSTNSLSYVDIIIMVLFIILFVLVYLRLSHKI